MTVLTLEDCIMLAGCSAIVALVCGFCVGAVRTLYDTILKTIG